MKKSIAYAYVPASCAIGMPVEIDIFGSWVAGLIASEPLYDPNATRVRS